MKTPTINQINGRLAQAPAIQVYKQASGDYESQRTNWRNRYFYFFGDGHTRTVNGNFTYGAARKELRDIAKKQDFCPVHYCHKGRISPREFILATRLTFEGVIMQVSTRAKAMEKPGHLGGMVHNFYKVRSASTLDNFDPASYFEKHIFPKYFYTEGLMMELQLLYDLKKEQVKEYYAMYLKRSKADNYVDSNKAIVARLRKKKNIVVDEYELISNARLLQALRTMPRYRKPTKATKAPSFADLLAYAESDSDTEDGMMDAAEEFLNDYENQILL